MTRPLAGPGAPVGSGAETTISTQLREQTKEHHRLAEQSPFQRLMIGGRLPLSTYAGWLAQMLWVYRALESHFPVSAGARPAGFAVTEWRRTLDLERDLQYWGVEPDATGPVAATSRFVDQLGAWAESDPVALLGVLYVLEGSTNGSRFIARSLRRAYPGADVGGMTFIDPYGESQPEHWRAFKVELDRVVARDAGPSLITAARATFDAVSAIGAELLAQVEGVGELDSATTS